MVICVCSNYHKRIAELEFKATKLKLDNERCDILIEIDYLFSYRYHLNWQLQLIFVTYRIKDEMDQMQWVFLWLYIHKNLWYIICVFKVCCVHSTFYSTEIQSLTTEKGKLFIDTICMYVFVFFIKSFLFSQTSSINFFIFIECLQHKRRLATPHMTSRKRRNLGLSLKEATSLSQLQAEVR